MKDCIKKYGIGWFILDVLLLLISLLNVLVGAPQPGDYFTLCLSGFLLVFLIGVKIYEEIRIRKKVKQMREENTEKK